MSEFNGQFCWYDLVTDDAEGATAFYAAVVGWEPVDAGHPDVRYTLLTVGGSAVAGLMGWTPSAEAAGAQRGWHGTIAVDDLDAAVARLTAAGGGVDTPAHELAGVGRFAGVRDPQGARFVLMTPDPGRPAPPAGAPYTPGHIGWRELHAEDGPSAFDFYAGQFGWTKAEAMDMGPMGVYQTFSTGAEPVGGMMTRHPAMPSPGWLFYFSVAEIDAATARVRDAGGQVLMGPVEVPGGGWIIQGLDPQGVMFALTGPRK